MSNETKIFLGVIGGTLLLIFGVAFLLEGKNPSTTQSGSSVVNEKLLVRPDSWKEGSDSAKVTVVEFSDFQCPSCKAAEPVVESIIAKYGPNLRFVYRHFPLPSHQFAFGAAEAVEAAGLQGKFWEMKAGLFKESPDLSRENLQKLASNLGLDINKFNKDFDSDAVRQKVLNDQNDGNSLGINATPTFYVNGIQVVGFGDLEKEVASRVK